MPKVADKPEHEIVDEILIEFGAHPLIWLNKNPVGVAFFGKIIGEGVDYLKLQHPRRVEHGLAIGSSDLIGMINILKPGIFFSLEVKKRTGTPSDAQINWCQQVRDWGGLSGIVRSVADVHHLIHCYVNGLPLPELK